MMMVATPIRLLLACSIVSGYFLPRRSIVSGFLLPRRSQWPRSVPAVRPFLSSTGTPDQLSSRFQDDDEPKLLLSVSEVESQMKSLRSKYPTSEADYLAAARARNAAKTASSERTATDEDWHEIAAEKVRAVGEMDDWDKSVAEAGNADSQILIPLTSHGEDGNDEPKLMLF
jgi:hypothetical protein